MSGWHERDHDLIVVGGGTAGMACAITAAEHGARVIVVEKTDDIGGTLHLSSGQLSAAGTRRQRTRGIEDSPDQHFDDVMALSHGHADPALVRLAVDEATRTIDWLDELGFEFDPSTPALYYGHEPYSRPRTYWGPEGGRSVLRALSGRWAELAGTDRVEVLYRHRADELIREGGAVVGVHAWGPDGDVALHAPCTVLTTGGYAANHEFFAERTPHAARMISACRRSSTGDGIVMAMDAGAVFRGAEHHLPTVGGFEPHPGSGYTGEPPQFASLNPATWPARAIHVNQRGERFLAEDLFGPDVRERAVVEQPGSLVWVVFDDASLADGGSFHPQLSADQVRQIADYGMYAWIGRDVASLAANAGVDGSGLARTIEEWNRAVESGSDPLGVREPGPPIATPPFYAFLVNPVVVISFGGITVDGELRVLDAGGEPIPGLYAAGEVLGASATGGDAFCGGMAVTPALSFGRILGRRLATAAAARTATPMRSGG
jgi:fumarate reductase flavoprotein subunit